MNRPIKFSIIIPTYNRKLLLKQTLESLLKQRYNNFEIIVVDDGGNDETGAMIKEIDDERISYFWKENAERGIARNYGFQKAAGDWINFFDSDDLAYPNHLQTAYEFIEANPGAEVFHTGYDISDEQKITAVYDNYTGRLNDLVIEKNIFSCNNVFLKRTVLETTRFVEERHLTNGEDWLLWLRLASRYEIWGVGTVTSTIVYHPARSVMILAARSDKMLKSAHIFRESLLADKVFEEKYLRHRNKCIAELYSLASLSYAQEKMKQQSLKWLIKAISINWKLVFAKRTFGIIYKNLRN